MSFGARELIWLLIAVLAVYVLLQLLRLRGAARGKKQVKAALAGEGGASSTPAAVNPGASAAAPLAGATAESVPALARDEVRDRAERIALELEVQQLRRNVAQLREELDNQCREGDRLAIEVGLLRDTVAGIEATQRVSPQYNEAVLLARRGLSAEAVAERCGISVAEAALVRSMIQREDQQGEDA